MTQELLVRRLLAPLSLEHEITDFPERVEQRDGEVIFVIAGEEIATDAGDYDPADLAGWSELKVTPPEREWSVQIVAKGPREAVAHASEIAMNRFINFGGESFAFEGQALIISGEGSGEMDGWFDYSFRAVGTPG